MKFVQRVTGRDGIERLYLRRKGYPRARLHQPWGSPALQAEVDALLEALAPDASRPGTMREAARAYELHDADFQGLRDSTKALYRIALKELEQDFGAVPIEAFTPAYILRLKNAWARRGHRAANVRLQVLKNVLKPAMIEQRVEANAFDLVGQVRRPSDMKEPHPRWPAGIVEAVIRRAIEQQRFGLARAVAIARYTGARRSDVAAMRITARQDGRIRFLSGKRRVPVDIREDPRLTRWLAETPSQQPARPRQGRKVPADTTAAASLTLVYNLAGLPYTANGLGAELQDLVSRMAAEGAIDADHYDLHGLRHTRGVELALTGATDAQGAAQLGQLSAQSFAQYRRQAERIRLADQADDLLQEAQAQARESGPAAHTEQAPNGGVKNRLENRCKTPAANDG